MLDVSPGPLQGLSESVSMKEEQVDKYKKYRTGLFRLGIIPRKPV